MVLPSDGAEMQLRDAGSLRDIAPTLLGIAGIPQPAEMTGRDLRTSTS
jgi:2,3-bisphosphoglycerate-independent phosphoglycerate mutase